MRSLNFDQIIKPEDTKHSSVPEGQYLFNPGDQCDHYVYIQSGTVRVDLLSSNGQQLLLYRIQERQSCVMTTACLLGSSHYYAHAVTESPVELLLIPHSTFHNRMDDSPAFREFVFSGFAQRLALLMQRTAELATRSIDQRLAAALLAAADRYYPEKIIMLTHEQLAVEVGTAREVISRRLANFEKQGLIFRHRGAVEILSSRDLEHLLTEQ